MLTLQSYFSEQATKPQTLAYALNDSPVALLAWIYEKMHDWSDAYPWTDEEILTWISIYQFSRAGPGSAHRNYYESTHNEVAKKLGYRVAERPRLQSWLPKVKIGLAFNPKELIIFPRTWTATLGEIVYESHNEDGGHFYAHERPEWLARDLKTMFGRGGGAFGVVDGKNGY
jgi:hypothetical protein